MEGAILQAGSTPNVVEVNREGSVYVLKLCGADGYEPENRWTLRFCRAVHKAFDAVESALAEAPAQPTALLTVTGSGKFFSNGIDVEWLSSGPPHAELREWNDLIMPAFARPLYLPIPTIAACTGHAFGAGFMFALGHDYILQRKDRGYLCAPEVAIGVDIPDAELELFRYSMPADAFFDTVLRARRWTAADALQRGVISATLDGDAAGMYTQALAFAEREAQLVASGSEVFSSVKSRSKGHVADGLLAGAILHDGGERESIVRNGRRSGGNPLPPGLVKRVAELGQRNGGLLSSQSQSPSPSKSKSKL